MSYSNRHWLKLPNIRPRPGLSYLQPLSHSPLTRQRRTQMALTAVLSSLCPPSARCLSSWWRTMAAWQEWVVALRFSTSRRREVVQVRPQWIVRKRAVQAFHRTCYLASQRLSNNPRRQQSYPRTLQPPRSAPRPACSRSCHSQLRSLLLL